MEHLDLNDSETRYMADGSCLASVFPVSVVPATLSLLWGAGAGESNQGPRIC